MSWASCYHAVERIADRRADRLVQLLAGQPYRLNPRLLRVWYSNIVETPALAGVLVSATLFTTVPSDLGWQRVQQEPRALVLAARR